MPGIPTRRVRSQSSELRALKDEGQSATPLQVHSLQGLGQHPSSDSPCNEQVDELSIVASGAGRSVHVDEVREEIDLVVETGEKMQLPACDNIAISRRITLFLKHLHALIALRGTCKSFNESFKERLQASDELRSAFCQLGQRATDKRHSHSPWVAVRVRPEKALHSLQIKGRSISMDAETIIVPHAESRKRQEHNRAQFYFDHVFDAATPQPLIWKAIRDPLESCIAARKHACVLAYGQTGSGKTHTMFGDQTQIDGDGVAFRLVQSVAALLQHDLAMKPSLIPPVIAFSQQGSEIIGSGLSGAELIRVPFIPCIAGHLRAELARCLSVELDSLQLFKSGEPMTDSMFIASEAIATIVAKHHSPEHDVALEAYDTPVVEFSFLEIYNESIYDLLADGCQLPQVRESVQAVVPMDTTKLTCAPDEVAPKLSEWLRLGASSRTIGETVFNPRSSRSHAVATVYLNWGPRSQSRIYLVDLAGSERAGKYHISDGQLREGNNINHGLSTLARVIAAIAEGRGQHVPLRDSALTWLLSDAIAGKNAKSFLLATVNPESPPETLSTLKYAQQFSSLQSKGGKEVAELGSMIRLLEVERKMVLAELDEKCGKCQMPRGWHRDVLGKEAVRPCSDSETILKAHRLLEWTDGHRRVDNVVGYIKTLDPKSAFAAFNVADDTDEIVEVVFKIQSLQKPLVLAYTRSALEPVLPPRFLLPLAQKAQKATLIEQKLTTARERLQKIRRSRLHEHQRLARV